MSSSAVRVTIGLPVHNGEKYIAAAIDSILCQIFSNFHLIISDNGSDDATQLICREYAARDSRIRYIRHDTNRGAAANFNYCVESASGDYFKWSAHDDIIEPSYLQKCVEQLDIDDGVILSDSAVEFIDARGDHIEFYDPSTLGTGKARASDRFAGRLRAAWCTEVFGVVRLDKLRQTVLLGPYVGSDRALLAELALWGRFAFVPEPLFKNRAHRERSTRAHPYLRVSWFATGTNRRNRAFRWMLLEAFIRVVAKRAPNLSEKLRCYWVLLCSHIVHGWAVLLMLEPLFVYCPTCYEKLARTMRVFRPRRVSSAARLDRLSA